MLTLLLACLLTADPPKKLITLPPVIPATGPLFQLDAKAEPAVKRIEWYCCTPGGEVVTDPSGTGRWATFAASKPGSYKVIAWTATPDGVPTKPEVTVIVWQGGKPDDGKDDKVDPPKPVVPYHAAFKAAWDKDAANAVASQESLRMLAATYKAAGEQRWPTYNAAYGWLKQQFDLSIPVAVLPEVRKAVFAVVEPLKNSDPAAIGPRLTQVATALEAVLADLSPTPKPDDGKPDPTPSDPSPFNEPGLRVMIVYEVEELSKLPSKQLLILNSGVLRDWLRENCVAVDGNAEFRFFDQNTNVANDRKVWQETMKRSRKSVPWIVVGNGKTGWEGPLPATVEDTLELVKRFKQ